MKMLKFLTAFVLLNFLLNFTLNAQNLDQADFSTTQEQEFDPSSVNSSNSQDLDFDSLDISGAQIKNEDKAFTTPGAISVREGVGESTQSIDSIIRSVPGAFTQIDQAQPGVSVNIRGMTGPGRVSTKIDGVSQSFFGTGTDSEVHGDIGTSSFTAPVDKNFLVGVDFERGTFSGGTGNALMGSANFRTMGVSDIVREGNNIGILTRYSYGSNAIGPSFMLGVAGRDSLEDGSKIGFLFANSGQNISQNYKTGSGLRIDEIHPDYDVDGDGISDGQLEAPLKDMQKLRHKPRSRLFKAEWEKDIFFASFQYRDYHTHLSGREIETQSYQFNAKINDPTKNYLDLNFLFAYTNGNQLYDDGVSWGYFDIVSGTQTTNRNVTMDINNAYVKELGEDSFFSIIYGLNYLSNRYSDDFPSYLISNDPSSMAYILTSFNPKGTQEIRTIYLDFSYKKSILNAYANMKFVDAYLHGYKLACSTLNTLCEEKEEGYITKDYTNFNYSFMISADFHTLFTPFISLSRTHRIPNIQEFFFTNDTNYEQNINSNLKAEQADTYQIGFNSFYHGLLSDNDILGFKALFYYTSVKNYIYNREYYLSDDNTGDYAMFLAQLNDDERAKFHGVELEFKMDFGFFYSFLSYTYQYSKHKFSDSEAIEFGGSYYGQSQFAQLPKHYANLDIGTRLFDEKFTLGALVKFTGKSTRIQPQGSLEDDLNNPDAFYELKENDDLPQIPTIVDLYLSLRPTKWLNFKFEVQNLLNEDYMDALYTYNSSSGTQNAGSFTNPIFIYSNAARGRSFVGSFEIRY